MARSKTPSPSVPTKLSAAQLRRAKALPIGNDFVLVRISKEHGGTVRPADEAQVLVTKAAVALKKPGIDKASVFRGAKPEKVYAYSVLPSDTSKVVRESADGTRQVGRLGANGRFRALGKAA